MFSQTSLTNRRKFLERSMLGFGSAFLLPSLLASCTDHNIPGPDPNPGPVPGLPGAELGIDWNADIKTVVVGGIGMIPEVGEVLGPIVDALWPKSGDSPWDQMKSNVEALMDQKMDDEVYSRVQGNLAGLQGVTTNYLNAITDKGNVLGNWTDLRNDFALYEPNFKQAGYEVLLLPLYAQFVNMYLTILRDAATHGDQWGMAPGDQAQARQDIDSLISEAGDYVDTWIPKGRQRPTDLGNQKIANGTDYTRVEPFASVNAYNRQMTLTVEDYRNIWPIHSLINYPNGKKGADGKPIKKSELLPREIYSDPFGTTLTWVGTGTNVEFTPIPLPSPLGGAPTAFPTQLSIWSGDRVDAIQVFYPQGSGPNGITQTSRMGGSGGNQGIINNTDLTALIDKFQVSTNSLTYSPYVAIVMQLQFADSAGNVFKFGTANTPVDSSDWISYTDEAVSSVFVSGNYGIKSMPSNANSVVVGFKYHD